MKKKKIMMMMHTSILQPEAPCLPLVIRPEVKVDNLMSRVHGPVVAGRS